MATTTRSRGERLSRGRWLLAGVVVILLAIAVAVALTIV